MSSLPPPSVDLSRRHGIAARIPRIPGLLIARLRGFPPQYRILLETEVFCGARVGPAGMAPLHVNAWRDLLNHSMATSCFKSLVAHATLPGRLYGLAGLYFTDPACLKTLAAPYLNRRDPVRTIVTCMVGEVPARELVERIVDGAWPEELRRGGHGIMPHRSSTQETHPGHHDATTGNGAA